MAGQEALADHPGHEVGQGRTVDAGGAHQVGLGQALVGGDRRQHRVLALGDRIRADLFGIDVQRHLQRAVQEMAGRAFERP